jgi:hypothetical protein
MRLLAFFGFLFLSGCAGAPTGSAGSPGVVFPSENAIQLVSNIKMVKGCKLVQRLSATAESLAVDTMRENVIADIKHQADALSITHLHTIGPEVEGSTVTIIADGYRCD